MSAGAPAASATSAASAAASGLSKQQLIIVGSSCLILVIFALMSGSGSGNPDAATTSGDGGGGDVISTSGGNFAVPENPPRSSTSQQQQQYAPPPALVSGGGGGKFPYRPPIRYLPSRFERGQYFPPGVTPLTMLKDGKAPKPAPPADWDGGYGWRFVKYIPSPWEVKWAADAPAVEKLPGMPLCDLRRKKYSKENDIYMQNLHRMPANSGVKNTCTGKIPDEPLEFDKEIFSRFELRYECMQPPCHTPPPSNGPRIGDIKYTYIEPLVGLIRHPNGCTGDYNWIINKNYMIIDPWSLMNVNRATTSPKPRVMYFDAGASTWETGAGGASQSWFYAVYESICLKFTDWFMWEAGPHKPAEVFKNIPGHLKPGYRWYNIPLTVDHASWDNPLNHLLLEARQEDIVILKIDFDTPHIENALIQQILDFEAVSELLQGKEMFYEHHTNFGPMRNWWGTGGMNVYYTDSLKMFTALREKGIRAHSWV